MVPEMIAWLPTRNTTAREPLNRIVAPLATVSASNANTPSEWLADVVWPYATPAITPEPAPRTRPPVIRPVSVSNTVRLLITMSVVPVSSAVDTLLLGVSVVQCAGPALPAAAHEISHGIVEPSLHASVALPLH